MSNFLPGFGTSWTKAKPHTQFTPFSDKNERWMAAPFYCSQQYIWQILIRKKWYTHVIIQHRPIGQLIVQIYCKIFQNQQKIQFETFFNCSSLQDVNDFYFPDQTPVQYISTNAARVVKTYPYTYEAAPAFSK